MPQLVPESAKRLLAGSVMSVAVALIAVATAAGASAPRGEHHEGFGYFPPPVEEAGPVTGAFTNVPRAAQHEVWLVDQSNTDPAPSPSFGGRIHIYEGSDLRRDASTAPA